jgi:hypothetical protein
MKRAELIHLLQHLYAGQYATIYTADPTAMSFTIRLCPDKERGVFERLRPDGRWVECPLGGRSDLQWMIEGNRA